jgi:hypothetical protein
MDVDTTVTGADRISKDLLEMADRAAHLEPVWDKVADMWKDRQQAVFSRGRLAPLSEASVRRKRVNKHTPMVDTGELRLITYRYSPVKSTDNMAVFGIPKGSGRPGGRGRKSIGAMHAVKSGSRPRRDVVPNWTAVERREFMKILSKYLTDRVVWYGP